MDWEAQGEIKGSLEEVGEGDQTAVVVATLDGQSIANVLHCYFKPLLSEHGFFYSCRNPECLHNGLDVEGQKSIG